MLTFASDFTLPHALRFHLMTCSTNPAIVGYNMSGWRTVGRMIKRAPKSDVAVPR